MATRLLALAADPAHLKLINMFILFLFRLTLLTLLGHLPECVGGIPLEVLIRSVAGAQSEIYTWQITPASGKEATIELWGLTIDVENRLELIFVFY